MASSRSSGVATIEPIALADGLLLDSEAEREARGNYLVQTGQKWEEYYAGSERCAPTLAEYISAIRTLHDRKDPALEGIVDDLRSGLYAGQLGSALRGLSLPPSRQAISSIRGYRIRELVIDNVW